MNKFILSIMKVYCTASLVYVIYCLYLKFTHAETVTDILKDNSELLQKYNKNKKTRIMVFIIGIIIGLVILVIYEPDIISFDKSITQIKSIVEDVSDISVI